MMAGMHDLIEISVWQRVQLGHAALQVVVDEAGVDVLHIKGPALDPSLAPGPRHSTDADLLVRPSHLVSFLKALGRYRWELVAGFSEGSPFEHAATYWHPEWGYVDVHRRFPGLRGDEQTFDRLWGDRTTVDIAGQRCPVPSVVAQRLILMLHAARKDSSRASVDLQRAWTGSDDATRQAVERLATDLDAQIGLAAATGHLDDFRGTPQWLMWTAFTGGGSRLDEWRARLSLAHGWRAKLDVLARSLRVNQAHLAMQLGHRPNGFDLAKAFGVRVGRGVRELVRVPLRAAKRVPRRRNGAGTPGPTGQQAGELQ